MPNGDNKIIDVSELSSYKKLKLIYFNGLKKNNSVIDVNLHFSSCSLISLLQYREYLHVKNKLLRPAQFLLPINVKKKL